MKLKTHSKEITSSNPLHHLHQCKQCGVIFEGMHKAVFSLNDKFMVDKCDNCRSFRSFIY